MRSSTASALLLLLGSLPACGDVDADGDGVSPPEDCDDGDPAVHPGAEEVCDGLDANCDGRFDEELMGTWAMDVDGDGWGDPAQTWTGCEQPPGWVADTGDCDDLDAAVHPGAEEICDGLDQDCDGSADDGLAVPWYVDGDGDGWGAGDSGLAGCAPPEGYSVQGGDCDDADPGVSPGAAERCDGLDQDCDGAVDEDFDQDGDGALAGEGCPASAALDCDDLDATVHPGAEEICGDGVDQNCEGTDEDCAFASALSLDDAGGRVLGSGLSAWAGRALDAGDVDGDGLADLVVGAMGHDGGRGAAGLSLGPVTGAHALGDAALVEGSEAGGGAGRDVALGDADGDGLFDLLVGAPYDTASAAGGAYLLLGPLSGRLDLGLADAALLGAGPAELCGHAVDLGDLTGDGLADLAVGVYAETTLSAGGGAVFVRYAPATGTVLGTGADARLLGPGNPGYLGHIVHAGADLSGDGIGDLCATAVGSTGLAPPSAGVVFVAEGPIEGTLSAVDAWAIFAGEAAYDYAGQGLGTGDLDGDGTADLLIGAPDAEDGAGTIYAVLAPAPGSAMLADAPLQVHGGAAGRFAGDALALGDLDGDGALDLLVGAPGADLAAEGAGAACVFYGPLAAGNLALSTADLAVTGRAPGDSAGDAVGIGDLDGDGLGELLIGAAYDGEGGAAAGAVFAVYPGLD